MAASFSIGKRGPTIRQGDVDPNTPTVLSGVSGDLYVRRGSAPKLYQFKETSWIDLTPETISRTTTAATEYTIGSMETYVGIRAPGNVIVRLPAGSTNRRLIIKDEVGRDAQSTISVTAGTNETIDGAATFQLQSRDALTIFYGAEWHVI
jgi:hypothetical protein